MKLKIKIKKLYEDVITPSYALEGDAGLDIYSREDAIIKPGEKHIFHTGFALEIPEGYCSLIWDKGRISNLYDLKVMGGVFEYTYRGEYKICIFNLGKNFYEFKKGDKIAQFLIQPIITAEMIEVDELSDTKRGHGRWGSTGK
ncbi:MAG: dUTP diphosphatase [Patescibacteria group bacterium]|nr:dUTP diphosphatase [Patescibacteria group bacterium]MDD4304468.1 dUTP diphosphatase [Patescibacteria group bacterium]MDD4694828.1 dUTP diphosphatase [Patescibacteria group bacterium]